MADKKKVNGIPVPEGLTHAEYMKAWRAPNTLKAIMDMGKKPDPKWIRMIREARVYLVLGVMISSAHVVISCYRLLNL